MIDFADPTAQVNALFSGAIDAMTDIPFAQLSTAKSHGNIKILESPGGGWLPLCMAVDMPPFDNVNVRKAMRLLVDRPAMLAQVLSGHGRVAQRPLRAVRRRLRQGAAAAPSGHRPGQVAAQGGRHGEPDGRPAHDGRRGRHGRLGQRLRRAGQGGRRDDQRQERPELLRRPVPQAGRSRSTSGARAATCRRRRSAASRARPTTRPTGGSRARSTSASTSRPWRRPTSRSATSS